MIEFFEDMAFDKGVQIREIGDHPRSRINSPGKAHFQDIVVAVPVWIVALPENAVILFLGQTLDAKVNGDALRVELGRRYRFVASHQLHSQRLTEEENYHVFRKCTNPYGHCPNS